jgi:hypothetical protein
VGFTKRHLAPQWALDHSAEVSLAVPLEYCSSDEAAYRTVNLAGNSQPAFFCTVTPGGTTPGSKRQPLLVPAAAPPPAAVRDAEGYDLRPDPLAATTAAELVAALREYRSWAGSPPFRTMAAHARQAVAHSTMHTAMKNDTELPRLKVVTAIIAGCGGDENDQRAWATAWRRIALGKLDAPSTAGTPTLRVLPPAAEANG